MSTAAVFFGVIYYSCMLFYCLTAYIFHVSVLPFCTGSVSFLVSIPICLIDLRFSSFAVFKSDEIIPLSGLRSSQVIRFLITFLSELLELGML